MTTPIIKLTKAQRTALKAALDSRSIAAGIALFSGDRDADPPFARAMDRYARLLHALAVLGIAIEGHDPPSRQDPTAPLLHRVAERIGP